MSVSKKFLTEDFKFSRSSGKVHLKYKGKQLAVLAEGVLFQLILDVAPMAFIKDLAKVAGVNLPATIPDNVRTLATAYGYKKLLHFGKKPNSPTDPLVSTLVNKLLEDKKVQADLKTALGIMKSAGINNCYEFIDAQVKGLQFVNNGEGKFPTLKQLSTAAAIDRVLEFTVTSKEVSSDKKVIKPKNYWFFNEKQDGTLALNKNDKYQTVLENIKKGKATMEELVYAQRCFSCRRNGQSNPVIEECIKKISH